MARVLFPFYLFGAVENYQGIELLGFAIGMTPNVSVFHWYNHSFIIHLPFTLTKLKAHSSVYVSVPMIMLVSVIFAINMKVAVVLPLFVSMDLLLTLFISALHCLLSRF